MDVNGIEKILYSGHLILASMLQTPELALAETEAKELSKAIGNVSRHYNVAATEKALDWSNLIMCVGMMYGTRLFAIRARRMARHDEPQGDMFGQPQQGVKNGFRVVQ